MTTKAELETELEELKETYAALEVDTKTLAASLVKSTKDLDDHKLALELSKGELESLKKSCEAAPKDSALSDEVKAELAALSGFMQKLYRESEWPPVREDIQKWRTLLATLCE